jgi:hypothetical protein
MTISVGRTRLVGRSVSCSDVSSGALIALRTYSHDAVNRNFTRAGASPDARPAAYG